MCKITGAVPGGSNRAPQEHRDRHRTDASGHRRQQPRPLAHALVDVADEPALRAVDADVDNGRALLHHRGRQHPGRAHRRDDDVGARGLGGEVAGSRVAEGDGRVAVQEEQRRGLADDVAAADHDRIGALQPDPVLVQQREHAERRPRHVPGRPGEQEPRVDRVEAVDVLHRVDRLDHALLGDLVGERQLHEDPVDRGVGVQLADQRQQLLLARLGRQSQVARLDPDLERRAVLHPDVDVRGGVVADEDRGDPDRARECGHLGRHLRPDPRRQSLPVHERRGHRAASINKLPAMEPRKWPRRNDAASIAARRDAIRAVVGDEPLAYDDEAWTRAQEAHTGVAAIPVSVVGPLTLELGAYELQEPAGTLRETGRAHEDVLVPLAHTEGGLSASMARGMKAAAAGGGFRTYVVQDRMTRASCFICKTTEDALLLARWLEGSLDDLRAFLAGLDDPSLSRRAKLREVKTHVVGPMCHVLWAWTTGDACGPNMMTRNSYALNMGYVMQNAPVQPERSILEANMGGDKKPSFEFFQSGHGKTVLAEVTLEPETVRRVLRTSVDDLIDLSWAGTHGAVASGMQSVAFTPASAIAAIFACTGQDLGMVGTSSMAHGTARRTDNGSLQATIRFPGLEVGTVGGGTTLPYARSWLALLGCAGSGKVYRFAQIVAAAALALELSASAAMATAGSENFFRAHHERGGLR